MDQPSGIMTYEDSNVVITKDNYMKYVFKKGRKYVQIYSLPNNEYGILRLNGLFYNTYYQKGNCFNDILAHLYANRYKVKKIEFKEIKEN